MKTNSTAFKIPFSFLHLREYLFSCIKFHNKIHFLFTQCLYTLQNAQYTLCICLILKVSGTYASLQTETS